MKTLARSLFGCLLAVSILAADPLKDAFQRGLLAEEAQRDFKAAADAYAEAVRLADTQRELVGTALFRLAEMQRRLGRTNEALAGYRRLVAEFSNQTNLVMLARAQIPADSDQTAGRLKLPPKESNGVVTVVGEVNQPGVIQLSRDSNLDVVQAIVRSGNFSTMGNPKNVQVRRGTNLFRFRFDEAISNRFELRSGDLVEVKKKVLNF